MITAFSAGLYLWYATPVYGAVASVRIEDGQTELGALSGVVPGRGYVSRIVTEMQVFKSMKVLKKAAGYIDGNISYYIVKNGKKIEQYPLKPFDIAITRQDDAFFTGDARIEFGKGVVKVDYMLNGGRLERIYKNGTIIRLPGIHFKCITNKNTLPALRYIIRFNKIDEVAIRILNGLTVNESAKFSAIAILNKTDANPVFAADALNAVMKAYLANDREQKTSFSQDMIRSIDEQLMEVAKKRTIAGDEAATFKKNTAISDPFASKSSIDDRVTNRWRGLVNKYEIHQKIFDFLVEKRLEAGIGKAALLAGAVVIDSATVNYVPFYPKPYIVWRSSLLLGVIGSCAATYFVMKLRQRKSNGSNNRI